MRETVTEEQRKARGEQLVRLRKTLELDQELLAQLGGLHRSEVSNAENGRLHWRSDQLWRGLEVAFGLARVDLEDYLDGRLSLEETVRRCKYKVGRAVRQRRLDRECDQAAREGLEIAGLREDELAEVVFLILRKIARREGPHVSREFLAERAVACRQAIAKAESALFSYKSVSEVVRTRR